MKTNQTQNVTTMRENKMKDKAKKACASAWRALVAAREEAAKIRSPMMLRGATLAARAASVAKCISEQADANAAAQAAYHIWTAANKAYEAAQEEDHIMTNLNPEIVTMGVCNYQNGVYEKYLLSYPFIYHDGSRSNSKRKKQSNDCTVRAVAIAFDLGYDIAYDLLHDAGRKCSRGFDFVAWINHHPLAEKISFPAIKGKRRMNPATFCKQFDTGVFICRVAKHVFTVKNGIVFDTFRNRADRCIYTAWKIHQPGEVHDLFLNHAHTFT